MNIEKIYREDVKIALIILGARREKDSELYRGYYVI